jgi:propionyl-CoA carboxylase alpha chain
VFKKLLIANRGEIACRILKTAQRMGISTVAVYSEADRNARHVELADEAVCIGPAASRHSYLVAERILEVCRQTGAEALHPGYGFLSENADFARHVATAGIAFIGPPAAAIAAMGDKISAKRLAAQVGVNTIPGHPDPIADVEEAVRRATDIGYPVMIKASAGGGGKGLRIALHAGEVREGFLSCRNEARSAFGDDRVFIEQFIEEPRHIEIQVLADAHGHTLYLWERECSMQRRHQKVLEEAPSPFVDADLRQRMGEQAVALARAVGYRSAGTVEFVVGKDRSFHFLEMNTRLQVEHPITERITGLDLVEWMIRIAAGEALPFQQADLALHGWAMECRINAEDPLRGFLPSTGRLVRLVFPNRSHTECLRVDTGVVEGSDISVHYDSMIAKLITHGPDRQAALEAMRAAMDALQVEGIATNRLFHTHLLRQPGFVAGQYDTHFISSHYPLGLTEAMLMPREPLLGILVATVLQTLMARRAATIQGQLPGHEYQPPSDWVVLYAEQAYPVQIESQGPLHYVQVQGLASSRPAGYRHELQTTWEPGNPLFVATFEATQIGVQVEWSSLGMRLSHAGWQMAVIVLPRHAAALYAHMPFKPPADLSAWLRSPMPGLLTEIAVQPGQRVKPGDRLAVVEAMKMENVLKAEREVLVAEWLAQPGQTLTVDQPILRFAALEGHEAREP